ncbi:unnamed protein product, partial [Ectocarpus sp. 12 AP-2014]
SLTGFPPRTTLSPILSCATAACWLFFFVAPASWAVGSSRHKAKDKKSKVRHTNHTKYRRGQPDAFLST